MVDGWSVVHSVAVNPTGVVVTCVSVTSVMTVSMPSVEGSQGGHDYKTEQANGKESFEHHFSATYDHWLAKKRLQH